MEYTDWYKWHQIYDSPNTSIRERLTVIGRHLHQVLDHAAPSPRIISVCAGQGREVLPAVAAHPRSASVEAHLLENDPRNAGHAKAEAARLGLSGVRVHVVDAGLCASYAVLGRAHCIMLAGVFSNIRDDDVRRTIAWLPCMAVPGGVVIWTHHGGADGLTRIHRWFDEARYQPIALNRLPDATVVGGHRFQKKMPRSAYIHSRLFTFVGRRNL